MIEKQVIRDFLAELVKQDILIGDDDSLVATKLLDSMGVAELIAFLESHYQVTFDSDDLTPDNLDSIHSIVSFLERKNVS
jgi:acyl carrier protein